MIINREKRSIMFIQEDQLFLVYKGSKLSSLSIQEKLSKKGFFKQLKKKNVSFFKMTDNPETATLANTEPSSFENLCYVACYNKDEVANFVEQECFLRNAKEEHFLRDITSAHEYHKVFPYIYKLGKKYGYHTPIYLFEELKGSVKCCCVIYDTDTDKLIAGTTTLNGKYTELYYGYTSDKEIMYSNSKEILLEFCEKVERFPNDTYMKDEKIYTFDGKEYTKPDTLESGREFIVYQGSEISFAKLCSSLEQIMPEESVIRCLRPENVTLAKIVKDADNREPLKSSKIYMVNGYDCEDIRTYARNYLEEAQIDPNELELYPNIFMVQFKKQKLFTELSDKLSFCSVIYDAATKKIIAGVTTPNSKYTHLYYGYTKNKREIIYSNSEEVLQELCKEIKEMPNNSYMIDGKIYTFDGKEYNKYESKEIISEERRESKVEELIPKNRQNADALIESLNSLLLSIANEALKTKIEQNIEEYLSSREPKEKIENFISNNLDTEMKRTILEIIKKSIQEFDIEHEVKEKIKEIFDRALAEYTSKIEIPIVHVIKLNDTVLGQTNGGFYHEKFSQILTQVQLDEPIMLIGPAGSGKNVAVSQVAQALGKHMYYTNNASNEFKLTGFIDAGGNYRETEFYRAFKNGGVFFLDELDNSDASSLIVINSALANGYMAFPHETIDRHPDFRIIAAANTWGKGSDLQYVGRNIIDAATLDRFDSIFFDYDRNLEKALYPNDEVLSFMWSFRDAVSKCKIPHIVSTRGIEKVYKKEINGIPVMDILTSNVIKNLNQDDINMIIGQIENIDVNNKYYKELKRVRVKE